MLCDFDVGKENKNFEKKKIYIQKHIFSIP
jgi:hypothetical protein